MSLLERQPFLDQMRGHLARASEGRGFVVSICGEAGIGKTALVRAFADTVANRVRVLSGACENLSTPEPLGALRDLARAAKCSLPEFGGATARLDTFARILEILDETPTLAIVEDLHWADDLTLDFVRYLGRRARDTRVLLLATARDEEIAAQARLRRTFVDIPAANHERIALPRLSAAAVRTLAGEADCDVADLFAATGGNAFFVTEALRGGDRHALPATVRDAVLLRAARLSPSARAALEAAAIFPRRVESDVLSGLCAAENGGIDECLAAGMLQPTPDDGYMFRHEIARRTVEATLSPERRRALNALALAALRVKGVAVARLVHHAREARDIAAVCELAPLAAQAAARAGAHRESAHHYAAALEHAAMFDPAKRASLYEHCAFEHQLISHMDGAISAHEAALALYRQVGDKLKEGDGLRWLSRLHNLAGDRAAAERIAREAIDHLQQFAPLSGEMAMAYSNFSHLALLAEDTATATEWSEKAIAIVANLPTESLALSHAQTNIATAKLWSDPVAARAGLEESVLSALRSSCIGREEHVARAMANRAYVEIHARDNRRAHVLLEEGIAYCAERDLDTWSDYMRGMLADLLSREARWDEAMQMALAVLENDRVTPHVRNRSALALARVRMRRGEADVTALLDQLASFAATSVEPPGIGAYAVLAAEHAWLVQADPATVLPQLGRAAALVARTPDRWLAGEIAFWRRKLAPETACDHAQLAEPYRLLFAGDWSAAAQTWLNLHAPYEQALALLEGEEPAQRRALDIMEAIGVSFAADRVRAELRERGLRKLARGPRASTRANLAGLTRRQMDVLCLIDRGLSNAEIAEKLFVSPKTIDHHVSAILAKLDAGSRGEAAAIARTTGLLAAKSA